MRQRGLRSAPSAGFGDPAEGIAGACKQGLCGVGGFGFGRFGRSSETPGLQPPGAARLAGDIGAIPCETQGGSIAGFFAGSEPRFFSEPGFWSRSDALRRPERGAGLATRGASAGLAGLWVFGGLCDFAGLAGSAGCGTNRGHSRNRRSPMPKPHARATRAISPGHLPMMVRLLARISRNDLHWLNTLDAQELRALLQLIATAKTKPPRYRDPA